MPKNLRAAAAYLYAHGNFHRWWCSESSTYEEFEKRDPIGFEEFNNIVEGILSASEKEERLP